MICPSGVSASRFDVGLERAPTGGGLVRTTSGSVVLSVGVGIESRDVGRVVPSTGTERTRAINGGRPVDSICALGVSKGDSDKGFGSGVG